MNLTMKLTFDGLIRALRFRQIALREEIAAQSEFNPAMAQNINGDQNDQWRNSTPESAL